MMNELAIMDRSDIHSVRGIVEKFVGKIFE